MVERRPLVLLDDLPAELPVGDTLPGGGGGSGTDEWRTALTATILLVALQSVARMGFADGWIDSLLDTSGLNLSNSVGAFSAGSAAGTAAAIATPTMTSNTAPSGVVYTNDDYGSPYAAWRAFNRTNVDYTDCWLAGTVAVFATSSTWRQLEYDFVTPVTITDVTIITRNYDTANQPKQWVIQGSNDTNNATRRTNTSGSWTTLDTRNASLGGSNATNNFTLSASGSYRYYRILVKETNAGSSYTAIGELQLKTAAASLIMEASAVTISGMSEYLIVLSVNSGKTFTVEIDAGSGWETVTLTRTAQSASIDQLSGTLTRSGGSSVKVKVTASDNAGVVYGWGLFWRA